MFSKPFKLTFPVSISISDYPTNTINTFGYFCDIIAFSKLTKKCMSQSNTSLFKKVKLVIELYCDDVTYLK